MNDTEAKYFDSIANNYELLDIGMTPARQCSEVYTVLSLMDFSQPKSVLELACSDGYFSRQVMRAGATSLMGIDLSPRMIELAKQNEEREPLGIQYQAGDIFALTDIDSFDIVFTPFVMSYAKNRQELLQMCKVLFDHIKPGGQLLSMNDHPDLPPDSAHCYRKYGKSKRALGPLADEVQLEVSWVARDKDDNESTFSFNCYYYTRATFLWALEQAGFIDIHFHEPRVSPRGMQEYGEEYWQTFLEKPLVIYIHATRPQG